MKKNIKHCLHSFTNQGFTLIEIMVVVGVLGILGAIAIPIYQNYIATSKQQSATSILEQFPILLESFRAENGKFPGGANATYSYKEDANGTDTSAAPTIKSILPDFKPRPSTYAKNKGILFDYSLTIKNPGTASEKATFFATGVRDATGIRVPPAPDSYEYE